MEYVAGPDLHVQVRERGPLSSEQAVRLGRDIGAALGTAHRHGILHRDVKPQNVLLDPDGRYRLTDFGSARLDGQVGVTTTGALTGTPDYTAPEVLAGRRGDARADLYALGLTMYFGLTGELPGPIRDCLRERLRHRPAQVAPAVPDWLDDASGSGDRPLPEDRYPTASAFDQALSRSAGGRPHLLPAAFSAADPIRSVWGLCPACGGDGGSVGFARVSPAPLRSGRAAAAESRLASALPTIAAEAARRDSWRTAALPGLGEGSRTNRRSCWPGGTSRRGRAGQIGSNNAAVGFCADAGGRVDRGNRGGHRRPLPRFAGLRRSSPACCWSAPGGSPRRRWSSPRVRATRLPRKSRAGCSIRWRSCRRAPARDLLADLTRMGNSLYARLQRSGDSRNSAAMLGELLIACCSAASDLALLDANLGRFERQRERLAARPPARWTRWPAASGSATAWCSGCSRR